MTEPAPIRLLLIDDHFVVRSGLVASLGLEDDFEVVAEADRGEEALPLFREHSPSLVLMDLHLPGQNGIAATRELIAEYPDAYVLIFSTFARDDEIREARCPPSSH